MTTKMYREVREQPEIIERILDEGWPEVVSAAKALREGSLRSVMIAARGTSDNAALYAKYLFETLLGFPTALASPSVFTLYESEMNLGSAMVIGISQSGESKDVLETVRRSRDSGATTLTLTNDENSAMAAVAHHHFLLRAGKEESVAATKTYVAQLMVLYLLAAALKGDERLGEEVLRLPEQARRILEHEWSGVERYRYAQYMVVTSRGYNFATAREAALKLMETSYVVAQAFSAADLQHGPIAMIGRDFPVVAIVPPGAARPELSSLVESLRERGAEVAVISEDESLTRGSPASFCVPVSCPEELSPVLYAIPSQMLSHDLAGLKGLDPDAPRGLSKVTETW